MVKRNVTEIMPQQYIEPLKVINYSLLIKKLLDSNDIKKANKVVEELWDYATHAQIDYEEEQEGYEEELLQKPFLEMTEPERKYSFDKLNEFIDEIYDGEEE